MRRVLLVSLFSFCAALPVCSEVVIKLKNGQTMSLPISQSDISSIEFSSGPVSISAGSNAKPSPQSEVRLIRTLRVTEYERNNITPAWNGVLTRIGESSNFEANWKSVKTSQLEKATLTMQPNASNKQITLIRSDNKQTYTGNISADGLTLEGKLSEPGKVAQDRRWTAHLEY